MAYPSPKNSYIAVMKPETSVKISLNKVTGKSVGQSGLYAGNVVAVDSIYTIEITTPPLKKFTEPLMRQNLLSIENAMNFVQSFEMTPGTDPDYLEFFKYKGNLSLAQRGQVTVANAVAGETQIYVNTTAVTGSVSGNLITTGDYIMFNNKPYQATENVPWSSSASITVPINRRLMGSSSGPGGFDIFGDDAPTFNVIYEKFIPYKHVYNGAFTFQTNTIRLLEAI